jgi:hypothetical protein
VQHSAGPNFIIEYLGEFEKEFIYLFEGVNLGPKCNRLTKKTEGQKSRDSVSLKHSEKMF